MRIKQAIYEMRTIIIIVCFTLLICVSTYHFIKIESNDWLINDIKLADADDPSGNEALDKLVATGKDGVPSILKAVGKWGTWHPRVIKLNIALKRIGSPAHEQILDAIRSEDNPMVKVRYIYALQAAFDDYSCTPNWLNTFEIGGKQSTRYTHIYLEMQLRDFIKDNVPAIITKDGRFSKNFLNWYKQYAKPKGPLPEWFPTT